MSMPREILVNPSDSTLGVSFITARWLFVMAAATPTELVGDPFLVDETIQTFDPEILAPRDNVGIGFSRGNCFQGYQLAENKRGWNAYYSLGEYLKRALRGASRQCR